jgi:hypothetical protein
MKILIFILFLKVVLVTVRNVDGNSHLAVEELFSEYFEWKMATHPQAATYAGTYIHTYIHIYMYI